MKNRIFPAGLLLLFLSSCEPVPVASPLPTPGLTQAAPSAVSPVILPSVTAPAFTAAIPTPPCDPFGNEYCLTDWKAVFQNPLGPGMELKIARAYPYGSTQNGQRDPHRGIDLESGQGDPVFAAEAGQVIFAGRDQEREYTPWVDYYGNFVVLEHKGYVYSLYGHLSEIHVSVGDSVSSSTVLGAVGNTGVAIGSHLHFELRVGRNPLDYLSTQNPELWLPLPENTGGLSLTLMDGSQKNTPRSIALFRLAPDTDLSEKKFYLSTYPKGFEKDPEDAVLSGLIPGRYRIAFTAAGVLYERVVVVQAGKITQVVIPIK